VSTFTDVEDLTPLDCAPGSAILLYSVRDSLIANAPHSGGWYLYCTQVGPVVQSRTGGITRLLTQRVMVDDAGSVLHDGEGHVWYVVD
jgi:hypothetical protein